MERPIDFSRDRYMLCGGCGLRFLVDLDWIDRWEQGQEKCPGCRMTCEHEDAPRVTVDPADLALDDSVTRLFWYHTSTQPDWPTKDFDPAAGLTAETRRLMGGDRRVAAWAESQRAKALHVGTYEAAIHNMLRRIDDQADRGSQFYLYRVHLEPTTAVRDGWIVDPSDFAGDVMLHDVCPPGINAARYLNYHEDPGGITLALGRDAIASVQRVAVPAPDACDIGWVHAAGIALCDATEEVPPPADSFSRLRRFQPSPQALVGGKLAEDLAARLPINLQRQFTSATGFGDGADPAQWARRTSGLIAAIENPMHMLALLDGQECRQL
ncbi:hypothetical protein E0H73_10385 [Kribbella pittospori]|uniref:Uncharacterized protein n=1 Tax=Kribbella pittospori TaxID=722689 RepID=A0A4R0KX70_9ACTN|nr:hypothetical protein [Kribbella pittospori]TCC64757.1 hypothetical protein E0H73_10385 [Kribbella pittospori]